MIVSMQTNHIDLKKLAKNCLFANKWGVVAVSHQRASG